MCDVVLLQVTVKEAPANGFFTRAVAVRDQAFEVKPKEVLGNNTDDPAVAHVLTTTAAVSPAAAAEAISPTGSSSVMVKVPQDWDLRRRATSISTTLEGLQNQLGLDNAYIVCSICNLLPDKVDLYSCPKEGHIMCASCLGKLRKAARDTAHAAEQQQIQLHARHQRQWQQQQDQHVQLQQVQQQDPEGEVNTYSQQTGLPRSAAQQHPSRRRMRRRSMRTNESATLRRTVKCPYCKCIIPRKAPRAKLLELLRSTISTWMHRCDNGITKDDICTFVGTQQDIRTHRVVCLHEIVSKCPGTHTLCTMKRGPFTRKTIIDHIFGGRCQGALPFVASGPFHSYEQDVMFDPGCREIDSKKVYRSWKAMFLASHATLFAWITLERSKTGYWTIEAHSWLEPEAKSNIPVVFQITITADPATAPHLHFGDFISLCPKDGANKWSFNHNRLLQFKRMAALSSTTRTTETTKSAAAGVMSAIVTTNTDQSVSSSNNNNNEEAASGVILSTGEAAATIEKSVEENSKKRKLLSVLPPISSSGTSTAAVHGPSAAVPPAILTGSSSSGLLNDKEDEHDDDNEIQTADKRRKLNKDKNSSIEEEFFRLSIRVVPTYHHSWHCHEMPGLPQLLGVPSTQTPMLPSASTGGSAKNKKK